MIRYKFNVMEKLKEIGYNSKRLRDEKLLGESYMTQLRRGDLVSWKTIDTLCRLLNCQVGDLVEYVAEDTPEATEQLFSTFQKEMNGDCGSSRLKGTEGQQTVINRGAPFSGIATFTTIFAICSGQLS